MGMAQTYHRTSMDIYPSAIAKLDGFRSWTRMVTYESIYCKLQLLNHNPVPFTNANSSPVNATAWFQKLGGHDLNNSWTAPTPNPKSWSLDSGHWNSWKPQLSTSLWAHGFFTLESVGPWVNCESIYLFVMSLVSTKKLALQGWSDGHKIFTEPWKTR